MPPLWPGLSGSSVNYISPPPKETFTRKKRRAVVVAGSTGSIGRNALRVIAERPEAFRVLALACATNAELLASQAARFRPPYLGVLNETAATRLRELLPRNYSPKILTGPAGYAELARLEEADAVLNAQVGAAGLGVSLAAAKAGKVLALANKESLVLAGGLLRRICDASASSILPVDSEHYALFQCVSGRDQTVDELILTASGGPFRGRKAEDVRHAEVAEALNHPNWNMGAKISIDSATLMNKGLEWIEAVALFGVEPERVKILVHPQSIVHSLVRFKDQSLLAQMAVPDMRLPIAGALLWPATDRATVKPLDLAGTLTFYPPDWETFPSLGLARKALAYRSPEWEICGLNPACVSLNAANEIAANDFLAGKLEFGEIPELVKAVMNSAATLYAKLAPASKNLEDALKSLYALDKETRAMAEKFSEHKDRRGAELA